MDIVLGDRTHVGLNSPAKFQFLVAESRLTDRVMLMNALLALGHDVETVLNGRDAYEKVVARHTAAATNGKVRQYDCVLMALEFGAGNTMWDGLQAIRMIRDWENLTLTNSSVPPVPIVAMTKLRDVVNDQEEALAAGANLLLEQTVTGYLDTAQLNEVIPLDQGTFTTGDMLQKQSIREDYNEFAVVVVKFLTRSSSDVLITSNIASPRLANIPLDTLEGLLTMTVGSVITIQGTVRQVNQALTNVLYFAPNNTQGNISFSVTVTDQPATCILSDLFAHSRADPNKVVQPATYSLLPTHGFNQSTGEVDLNASNIREMIAHLCDQVGSTTVTKYIPLFVVAVNQAPEMSFDGAVYSTRTADPQFSTGVDTPRTVPTVFVEDLDHLEAADPPTMSSFGYVVSPPMTLTANVVGGRLSFPVLSYTNPSPIMGLRSVTVTSGLGKLDRHTVLRGPMDAMNVALAAMTYVCRRQDGCVLGYNDTITIIANDEGFSGKGGPLTQTMTIKVAVQ